MANTREVIGEQECLDAIVEQSITSFEDDGITSPRAYALYGQKSLTSLTLPYATNASSNFAYTCTALAEVNMPSATVIYESAFGGDVMLERATFGNVTSLYGNSFRGCYRLRELNVGTPQTIGTNALESTRCLAYDSFDMSQVKNVGSKAFVNSGIGKLVLPNCTSWGSYATQNFRTSVIDLGKKIALGSNYLNSTYSLCHLILRGETSTPTTLNSSALTNTPLAGGLGWIYVPDGVVNAHKANSSWSAYANQIVGISEYPKAMQDETVSDSWSTIASSTSYATDYPIGSVKYLDVGGTQVAMVLVAVDTDDIATGGKARMTWISRDVLDLVPMNGTNITTKTSWDTSYVRTWLRTVIFEQIDPVVRNAIKGVTKTYEAINQTTLLAETRSSTDTLWVPSIREVFGYDGYEDSGQKYTAYFDNASKVKKRGIAGTAVAWYLRSLQSVGTYHVVGLSGTSTTAGETATNVGVVFGFCI